MERKNPGSSYFHMIKQQQSTELQVEGTHVELALEC